MNPLPAFLACAALVLCAGPTAATPPDPEPGKVPGALASWDFEDVRGDTLRDRSGNGHHGIVHGARWVKGFAGGGLAFDGDDWVMVPADPALEVRSFTLSLWLWQSGNATRAPLVQYQPPHDLVGIHLSANTSGWANDLPGAFYANLRPHDASASQPGSVRERNLIHTEAGTAPGGRWNHVVLTLDHGALKARLWVNGRLCASRALEPFTPRTHGDIWIGRASPTGPEWDAGMGLVGILDQIDLYGRALSEAEIRALYNQAKAEPGPIHLGIRTHFAKAGDTLLVPVLLSSDGRDSLSSLQFDLVLDTAVAELLDVAVDTAVGRGWEVSDWSRARKDTVTLALAGTRRITGEEEGELLRLRFRVRPDARPGASTMLTLARLSADEGRRAALTHGPGRIFVIAPAILHGDVDGDGEVDLEDARAILRHVVGELNLPDPAWPVFTKAVADVSGNGDITAYDAALVVQWSLGCIDEFPAARPVLARRGAAGRLILRDPERVGEVWRHRLVGADLAGLIGGGISLSAAPGVISVARVVSLHPGLRVTHRWNPSARRLELALAGNRGLRDGEAALLEVEAIHAADGSGGFALSEARLNEGALDPTLVSGPVAVRAAEGAAKGALGGRLRATAAGSVWRVSLAGQPLVALDAFDAGGARVFARTFAAPLREAIVARQELPAGMVILRALGPKGWRTVLLPPAAP